MPTKPWYFSKTILAGIVSFVLTQFLIFHIDLRDLAPKIVDATSQLIDAIISVVTLAGIIYGRVAASKAITLTGKPPAGPSATSPARNVALLLLLGVGAGALSGCATTNPTPTPNTITIAMPSSAVTSGIELLTTAGVSAGLDLGVQQASTRDRLGGYIYTGATLTLQLAQGQPVTPTAYQQYLATYGVKNDSDYAAIAATITSLYASFVYPKIANADASSGAAVDAYLTAFATGLQAGAAAYAPNTVLTNPASN